MQRGFITRAYNSYYYVQTLGQVEAVACKLRGRFKKERFSLLVGDEVAYSPVNAGEGIIEEIMPRRSLLERPPIANVDQRLWDSLGIFFQAGAEASAKEHDFHRWTPLR